MSDIIEMDDLIFESLLLQPRVQKYGITVIIDWNGWVLVWLIAQYQANYNNFHYYFQCNNAA